jgi:hypothetical protein
VVWGGVVSKSHRDVRIVSSQDHSYITYPTSVKLNGSRATNTHTNRRLDEESDNYDATKGTCKQFTITVIILKSYIGTGRK